MNGKTIAVSAIFHDDKVQVWDLATGKQLGEIVTVSPVNKLAVGQLKGKTIAISGTVSGLVRVWDLAAGKALVSANIFDSIRAVAVGQLNGKTIAVSASLDKTVRVWDLAAGKPASLTGRRGSDRRP